MRLLLRMWMNPARLVRSRTVASTLRALSCSSEGDKYIRRAQSAEAFRSAYSSASKNSVSISVADIDDLVKENYVRPSPLISAFQLGGLALGSLARVMPSSCTNIVTSIVDEAARTSLNNGLREGGDGMQGDIKDTLKYHRDMKLVESETEKPMDESVLKVKNIVTFGLVSILEL